MFNSVKQKISRLVAGVLLIVPKIASAADTDGPFNQSNFNNGFGINDSEKTVAAIALNVFDVMLRLIGYGTIIFIVYYGIMMITSQGDSGKAEQAKKSLVWAIVGIIVIGISLYLIQATKNATVTDTI